MPKPEPELTAIAEALQIDVRTLRNWRKRDGFPHGEDSAAVKVWADRNGLGRLKDSTPSELKAELMREQIRLARSKNERESGDVIDREVVEDTCHGGTVGDVGADEDIAVRIFLRDVGQAQRIRRIGQLVHVDDAAGEAGLGQQVADEVGADEAAAAGNQEIVHGEL